MKSKTKKPPRWRWPKVPAAIEVAAEPLRTYSWNGSLRSQGADLIVGLSRYPPGLAGEACLWLPAAGAADLAKSLTASEPPTQLSNARRMEAFRTVLKEVERLMLAPNAYGTQPHVATMGLFSLLRTVADGSSMGARDDG